MSHSDLDHRTRLLLRARVVNGINFAVSGDDDERIMRQMVREGLFTSSNSMFSEGYWWTPAGEQAAEQAWHHAPVRRFDTCYRDHPQVCISLSGHKEELCHVVGQKTKGRGLWVREMPLGGRWLVDHPNGTKNVSFKSADAAIAWALKQVGKPRR